jgi:hypothetical protein
VCSNRVGYSLYFASWVSCQDLAGSLRTSFGVARAAPVLRDTCNIVQQDRCPQDLHIHPFGYPDALS